MSTNVQVSARRLAVVVSAGTVSLAVAWMSAATSSAGWSPPPPSVGDGMCARACEVAACLSFDISPTPDVGACTAEAASQIHDLRRAGPDRACVEACQRDGLPAEVVQVHAPAARALVTR